MKQIKHFCPECKTIFDYLVKTGIATKDEIRLVTDINGYRIAVLNDILYARTGYRSLEQIKEGIE